MFTTKFICLKYYQSIPYFFKNSNVETMYFCAKIDWTGSRAIKTSIIIRNQQNVHFSGLSDGIFGLGTLYIILMISIFSTLIDREMKQKIPIYNMLDPTHPRNYFVWWSASASIGAILIKRFKQLQNMGLMNITH